MENYVPHKTLTRKISYHGLIDKQNPLLERNKNCIIVPKSLVSLRIGIPIAKSDPQLINTWLREKNAHISNIIKASLENNNTKPSGDTSKRLDEITLW